MARIRPSGASGVRRARHVSVIEPPLVHEFGGGELALNVLAVVRFQFELAMPVDVLKVGLHTVGVPPPAGDLYQDLFRAGAGGPHMRGPPLGRMPADIRLAAIATGIDASRLVPPHPDRAPLRHWGRPMISNSPPA